MIDIPISFVWFFLYGFFKSLLADLEPPYLIYPISSGLAEMCIIPMRNPFEVVIKQQQLGLDESISDTVRNIYRRNGIYSFFSGIKMYMVRDVPYAAVQFFLFEVLSLFYADYTFLIGFVASMIATIISTPLDVIKTVQQTNRNQINASIMYCVEKIWSEQKLAGFFSGLPLRIINNSISGSLYLTIFKKVQLILAGVF